MQDDVAPAAAEAVADSGDFPAPADPAGQDNTARGAIERAFASVEASQDDGHAQEEQAETVKVERKRNSDGTFASQDVAEDGPGDGEAEKLEPDSEQGEATTFAEPPKRFSADAKAAWVQAPEPVRAEITRAISELEKGISEYQQRFEPLRPYEEMAQQYGTTIEAALANYTGIEKLIAQDPVRGLNQVCENMGLSLRQVAESVLDRTPDQAAAAQDSVIRELRQEIAGLKNDLSGVSSTIRMDKERSLLEQVNAFSADKPRFDELSEDIALLLKTERAKDLQEAYEMAERLNPAPQAPAAPAAQAASPAQPAQPRKGQLSLTGAPSSGSNPANRKPPSTAREAIDNAFSAVGL